MTSSDLKAQTLPIIKICDDFNMASCTFSDQSSSCHGDDLGESLKNDEEALKRTWLSSLLGDKIVQQNILPI